MPFDPTTPRSRDEVLLQAIVSGDSSMMGDPRDREEEFVKAIADKETLPDYSEASNGDVLQIGADGPEWGSIPNELPAIAAGDAGKVLKVNSSENGVEWGNAGGGHIYLHMYTNVSASRSFVANAWYFDSNPTTDWRTFLSSNGFTTRNTPWGCCSGYSKDGGTTYPVCGVFILSSTEIGIRFDSGSSDYSVHGTDSNFNDKTTTYQLI